MEKLFGELEDDIIKDYMINFMTVDDISLYCSTNNEYLEICKDNELWERLVNRDFGIHHNSIIAGEIINILNNGERNFYALYRILSELYKYDEKAIIKLIEIFLNTDNHNNIVSDMMNKLLIGKSVTELKNIYRLTLEMFNGLNSGKNIFPNSITKHSRYTETGIMIFLISIQKEIDKRLLLIILSEIKVNGKKLLKSLDKAYITDNNYSIKLEQYQNFDHKTVVLFNSKTKESYWYILSLLAYFYYYQFDHTLLLNLINKNIDNEIKHYLHNYNIYINNYIKDIIISFYANNNIFQNFIPTNPEFISLINKTLRFVKIYYITHQNPTIIQYPSQQNIELIIDIFLNKYNLYETPYITLDIVNKIRLSPIHRHIFSQFRKLIS